MLGMPMEWMRWMRMKARMMRLIRTALRATAEQAHILRQVRRQPFYPNHILRVTQMRKRKLMSTSHLKLTNAVLTSTRSRGCLCTAAGVEEVEANQDVPSIEETARLFIRNLPYGATEANLAEAFQEHGEISEVHLVLDRYSHGKAWTL